LTRGGPFAALIVALVLLFPAARIACAADDSSPSPAASPAAPTPAPDSRPLAKTSPGPIANSSPSARPRMPNPDEWAEARSIFEQFSPDQKKKFLDNLNQWKAMSPEEQELYRDRELFRRQKIAEEIQDAITKSGLKLDEDEREVFALRYTQERRKIEEALHKEMDAERQAMVSEMLGRLKTEFSGTSASSPVVFPPDRSSQ
jgi:hypothetical protein